MDKMRNYICKKQSCKETSYEIVPLHDQSLPGELSPVCLIGDGVILLFLFLPPPPVGFFYLPKQRIVDNPISICTVPDRCKFFGPFGFHHGEYIRVEFRLVKRFDVSEVLFVKIDIPQVGFMKVGSREIGSVKF